MMTEWYSKLDKLAECGANLYTQLEQISEENLDRSREKGSWTIRQIVNHLAEIKAILNLE